MDVTNRAGVNRRNMAAIKGLTYLMFAMFAMTTDSVGLIIPEVIRTFGLSLTAAGAFQYATMGGIALAGLFLGQLADRFGRRPILVAGLTLFAAASFAFAAGETFLFFTVLMGISGVAIGVFKTAALALVGDISTSTAQHTAIMNMAEGFFGIGSIAGPAILARLLGAGVSWQWLYVLAGGICVLLIVTALQVGYPESAKSAAPTGISGTATAMKNRFVLAFSIGVFLYVAVEAAIYVWMPTLLSTLSTPAGTGGGSTASWLVAYSLSIFFLLRAAGRFLGTWMLTRFRWQVVLAVFSGSIFVSFVLSVTMGAAWAVYLLPLSGLFMSVIYPTLNSKGISCLPRTDHGAAAGVILFFTCVSAVLAPLAMGAVGDAMGHIVYGFWLAAGLAGLLFAGLLLNWVFNPTRTVLERLDLTEYQQEEPAST
jgi:fucose permease